ncbi:YceD family protein [Corynebacterium liangguodongii]|uniref:DNA-binding protein n=1 Tax=Corynebacterium liangguodongii TaxID=2079535 RepID=A0A2S0WF32_9CORY|nr:YceD family protein [Corynebacterium liangguodongii]AWB84272.1 DNA-binding protein [Corynebacterium liangguodongii]PWC00281.1 DNA-binding protein [Corynebacterium liangguodongii]
MANPFVFNVAEAVNGDGMPVTYTQSGPSPSRIGPEMIALPAGGHVTVEATITPLGSGVLVDATATGTLDGECVRCLAPLTPEFSATVSQVFSASEDFITGAEADEDKGSGDEVFPVIDDTVDLEQAFVDEMGMNLPFNPACEPECKDTGEVPQPDGVSGEAERIDPRWAGLEKFL